MKKIGILGTGVVGHKIGTKLIELGYEVRMGSRTHDNSKAMAWAESMGHNASFGTFEGAAGFGDLIINCTKGEFALEVLRSLSVESTANKILIDISNPLDFSKGMPPFLISSLANTNSLGEEIQKSLPNTKVVKTLNTVSSDVMVNPEKIKGEPTMFICGNDAAVKIEVMKILNQFGWKDIIDIGDISASRGIEMILPIWVRTMFVIGNGNFAFKVLR
jgi:8-hydroxy-5-deazaflavin:NADPH oxidoreductase